MGSRSISVAKVYTNVGERKRSFKGNGSGLAWVVAVLSKSSVPARAIDTLVYNGFHTALLSGSRLGRGVEGCLYSFWTLAKAATAVRRVFAHPRRMSAKCIATKAQEEVLLTLWVRDSGSPVEIRHWPRHPAAEQAVIVV